MELQLKHYGPVSKKRFTSSQIDFELLYYVMKKFYITLAPDHLDQLRIFLLDAMLEQVEMIDNRTKFNNAKYLEIQERYASNE